MSTDYARALGARLRAIRKQQGLSLHGVEEKSGRSLEGGRRRLLRARRPRRHRPALAELADFYGVPVAELLPDGRPAGTEPPPRSCSTSRAAAAARREGRSAGPLRRDHPGAARRLQRQGALDPHRGPASLAIIYDMTPGELTEQLIDWGVLSPGMEGIVDMGPDDETDDELDPHWEHRRSPR